MRLRIITFCVAGFSVAALLTSAAMNQSTVALWSDRDELSVLMIQSMHGTVTATSLSTGLNNEPLWESVGTTDPQTLFRVYRQDKWVMGPTTCTLDSVDYDMCATYTYNMQTAKDAIQQAMVNDPPLSPDSPKTYSIASIIQVDAEVWGYFGTTMGFHSTANQSGNSAYSWFLTVVESMEDCTADTSVVTSPIELIQRQYAHKQKTVFICQIQSYSPYLYQNTVTVSSGQTGLGFTHTGRWWGVFIDPDTHEDAPSVTIGVNVNE